MSPGYHGACSQLPEIAAAVHAGGAALVVDEAWGAHLPFLPGGPPDALRCGADAVVTSLHKQLTALSSGALLLARGPRLDLDRLAQAVRMTQTTSPYLPLLASIDDARYRAVTAGRQLLGRAAMVATALRSGLAAIDGVAVLGPAQLGIPADRYDPLRLLVDVSRLGMTGVQVDLALRAQGFAVEGADARRVLFLVGPGDGFPGVDGLGRVDALIGALDALATSARQRGVRPLPALPVTDTVQPRTAMPPREAWYAPCRPVPVADAIGRVCAEVVTPYPPGIPTLLPGELVTAATVARLRALVAAGVCLHGIADPDFGTLRVLAAGVSWRR